MRKTLLLLSALSLVAQQAETRRTREIRHVLLISVDGLHALDVARFVETHPRSTLAELSRHGVTYTNASCSKPSDSFPGLLAMLTGGTPNSTGVFYDVSYSRGLRAPGALPGASLGTEVAYDESIDINPDALDAGGGIDPTKLPVHPVTGRPIYPHEYLRVNTIFEVAKAAGHRTAWSDKHPAYEIVQGPSGHGVDDLFTPEINANGITKSVPATEAYDDIKVQAIVNEIEGLDHAGLRHVGTPAIFGMNFQAVSVAQKLPIGGYLDGDATPSTALLEALEHTDASLGRMLTSLKARGLWDRTLVIVSAKHGQGPINPTQLRKIDPSLLSSAVNSVSPDLLAELTADDGALIWLKDSSRTAEVVTALCAQATALGIEDLYAGESLKLRFNDPALDGRVPDIIIQPVKGVLYSTSKKKNAEHGGFSEDDTHVALIVAHEDLHPRTLKNPVQTTQIAPTILRALGLDPRALEAVRKERTEPLPGIGE